MTQLSIWRGGFGLLAILVLLVPLEAAILSPGSRIGPWEAVLCEGASLNMVCPMGYQLRIEDGFYGRADGFNTCMEDEQPVSVIGCTSRGAIEAITSLCENHDHCSFLITGDVFGNPCSGFQHYLNVSFSCELVSEGQTACDGDWVGLECYEGQELRIESVLYGRADDSTCDSDGMDMSLTCSADDAAQKVAALCDGREWCYVEAGENFFGDPCPSTSKYLQVNYTCAECMNDHPHDEDCELWASWGDCENEQMDWMFGYCRKTCTGCHLFDSCLNIAADDDCYYWAFIGECDRNPNFMNSDCRRSCNLCTEDYVPPTPEPEVTTWAPDVYPDNVQFTTACENEDAVVTCPAGYHIKIFDTFYGRRRGSACMEGTQADTWECVDGSPDPFLMTSYLCNGRQSCSVYSGMPPFSDPCPGIDTSRYLEIDWTCEPCANVWESDEDCLYWQSWYECDYNRYWMNSNCFTACSGCNLAENCDNVFEEYDCDYWALWGECENNPNWMALNCAKSCRTCWALN